jgi:hypothetical protein
MPNDRILNSVMKCLTRQCLLPAGKFARSAAVGVVAPPKAQMLAKQDWTYVPNARQVWPRTPASLVVRPMPVSPILASRGFH